MHRQYIKFNTKSNNNDSNNKDSDKWTYRENSGIDQVMWISLTNVFFIVIHNGIVIPWTSPFKTRDDVYGLIRQRVTTFGIL